VGGQQFNLLLVMAIYESSCFSDSIRIHSQNARHSSASGSDFSKYDS